MSLKRRHRRDVEFKILGWGSLGVIFIIFIALFFSILVKSWSIFWIQEVQFSIKLPNTYAGSLSISQTNRLLKEAFIQDTHSIPLRFEEVVSMNAWKKIKPQLPSYKMESYEKAATVWAPLKYAAWEIYRKKIPSPVFNWIKQKKSLNQIREKFNWDFFSSTDSLVPETAGILSALVGTIFIVTLAFTIGFPLGLLVAIYMECFMRQKTKLFSFVSININNLAAVPSITFGLLALALFLNIFQLSRSSVLIGGLTLSLIMLPLIVVSSRMAISQVPKNLREGALALGASQFQAVFHHVVPVAMPGIITGALLSLSRIIGESAPLLMVGLVIFSTTVPTSLSSPATVFPLQIYQWFQRPEPGFIEASSAAIIVLLGLLLILNSLAIFIRKKFQKFDT